MSVLDLKPSGNARNGGLLAVAVVMVGGFLRLVIPTGGAPNATSQSNPALKSSATTGSTDKNDAYQSLLRAKIKESFGCQGQSDPSSSDDQKHWNVPASSRNSVRFVTVFVPDPIHTHLGLLFDRSVNALELAVMDQGDYVFDRAVLPWKIPQQSGGSPATGQGASAPLSSRELFPGLLIFRKLEKASSPASPDITTTACPPRGSLFVFLVAETPTGGIRAAQFQNALGMIRDIRSGVSASGDSRVPLLLLGPNFSGSLDSLSRQLKQLPSPSWFSRVVAYSGSISGADSVDTFRKSFSSPQDLPLQFASFQENDDYTIQEFTRFAYCRGYTPDEIAILAEDDTVYGSQPVMTYGKSNSPDGSWLPECNNEKDDAAFREKIGELVHLHFPREISFFRSAYEKELAAQAQPIAKIPGKTSLPSVTEDSGSDDDAVAPYANGQTSLSQEAVMGGVVSELQKHHIKFTILLATNPVDQVFLARYLRANYPQGRVVVTQPDLLFTSQQDTLLSGVLGLNNYSLIPGLGDSLCYSSSAPTSHTDRLFDSSSSVGIYNAMLGLVSYPSEEKDEKELSAKKYFVPAAAYADYSSPELTSSGCQSRPLLWLTILGGDGFWPMAGFTENDLTNRGHDLPIVPIFEALGKQSTLPRPDAAAGPRLEQKHRTRTAWNVTYSICLALLILHIYFSYTGSYLLNSESQAQFTRSHDFHGVLILAIGAFWLSVCFVLITSTRNPLIDWVGRWPIAMDVLLWSPLPLFAGFATYDIAVNRKQRAIGLVFATLVSAMTLFQVLLSLGLFTRFHYLWSNRLIHFSSGVSPILPFLLLFFSGYWWTWLSLRSVSLVDLRRPRLPLACHLPPNSQRISDTEGETVRNTAHPLRVPWRIVALLAGVVLIAFTALDWKHPLQSLEGHVYDLGYFAALCLAIAVFLGCLMRLVFTWFDYKQVLSGLDRTPLREAFSRMKRLSWRSMWNPGGSTLRETYRVMARTLENMSHLKRALAGKDENSSVAFFPLPKRAQKNPNYESVLAQIGETEKCMRIVQRIIHPLFAPGPNNGTGASRDEFVDRILAAQEKVDSALAAYSLIVADGCKAKNGAAKNLEEIKCQQGRLSVALEQFCTLREQIAASQIVVADSEQEIPNINSNAGALAEVAKIFSDTVSPSNGEKAGLVENFSGSAPKIISALASLSGAIELYVTSSEEKSKRPTKEKEKSTACEKNRSQLLVGLMKSLELLQKQLANTAGVIMQKILDPIWRAEIAPAVSEDERIKRPELDMTRAIAEEFAALVYVNFLQSVLLQMRTLVICAGGMYVFILCSISVYPFEPHPALQIVEVALLVTMAAAIGFVYAEMHRDAILSRLTSTMDGKLGWDFWLKFVSAGAIPVFSLLAVQFPEISRFLFSWLGPALQAIK